VSKRIDGDVGIDTTGIGFVFVLHWGNSRFYYLHIRLFVFRVSVYWLKRKYKTWADYEEIKQGGRQ